MFTCVSETVSVAKQSWNLPAKVLAEGGNPKPETQNNEFLLPGKGRMDTGWKPGWMSKNNLSPWKILDYPKTGCI